MAGDPALPIADPRKSRHLNPVSALPPRPLLKICGLRDPDQAADVARLGADAIGVIAVATSPRYLPAEQRPQLFEAVHRAAHDCLGVLVVADPVTNQLGELDACHGHQVIQLHGQESPAQCQQLRQSTGCAVWKALRIRVPQDLERASAYTDAVDAVLLDAWVADQLGGTGHRVPLEWLESWNAPMPWWLAGGISPEGARGVLNRVSPTGLDASSSVEISPGEKDLERVKKLLQALQ